MQQKYCLSDYCRNYKFTAAEIFYIFPKQEQKLTGEQKAVLKVYQERNQRIKALYIDGNSVDELALQYGLSKSTIKRIIYN